MIFDRKYVYIDNYDNCYLFDTNKDIESKFRKRVFAENFIDISNDNFTYDKSESLTYIGQIKYTKYCINYELTYKSHKNEIELKHYNLDVFAYTYNEKTNKKYYINISNFTNIDYFLGYKNVLKCNISYNESSDYLRIMEFRTNNFISNIESVIDDRLDLYIYCTAHIFFESKVIDNNIQDLLKNNNELTKYMIFDKKYFRCIPHETTILNYIVCNNDFNKYYKKAQLLAKNTFNKLFTRFLEKIDKIQ